MGIMGLIDYINVACPWCNEPNEIDDVDVSVTVENYDISRSKDDGVFSVECSECGQKIEITAQLDVGVAQKK